MSIRNVNAINYPNLTAQKKDPKLEDLKNTISYVDILYSIIYDAKIKSLEFNEFLEKNILEISNYFVNRNSHNSNWANFYEKVVDFEKYIDSFKKELNKYKKDGFGHENYKDFFKRENPNLLNFLIKINNHFRNIFSKINDLVSCMESKNHGKYVSNLSITEKTRIESIDIQKIKNEIDILFWGIMHILLEIRENITKQINLHGLSTKNENLMTSLIWNSDSIFKPEEIEHILANNKIVLVGHEINDENKVAKEMEILMRIKQDVIDDIPKNKEHIKFLNSVNYYDRFVKILDWHVIISFITFLEKECFMDESKKNLSFSININPITIKNKNFVKIMQDLLNKSKINPERIILEILEYWSIEDYGKVDEILWELRKMGIKIAIDDYPSWKNNLNNITRFKNIDIIKIDGVYVIEMFKTCYECDHKNDCNKQISSSNQELFCLKNTFPDSKDKEVQYKLETFIKSLNFLKSAYPNVKFFAERISDEKVFNFLKLSNLISWFQWYYFSEPKIIFDHLRTSEYADVIKEKREEIKKINDKLDFVELKKMVEEIKHKDPSELVTIEELSKQELNTNDLTNILDWFRTLLSLITSFDSNELILNLNKNKNVLKKALDKIFEILGINRICFYFKTESNAKQIKLRQIYVENWEVWSKDISLNLEKEVLSKKYYESKEVNLYKLIQDVTICAWSWLEKLDNFCIATQPVPWEWDDAVLKINDDIYIWIDKTNWSLPSTNIQKKFLTLLWYNIMQKLEFLESNKEKNWLIKKNKELNDVVIEVKNQLESITNKTQEEENVSEIKDKLQEIIKKIST